MLSQDDILKLIGLPENNRLKYEAVLPSTNDIGRLISAFANTSGGVLILGILNKNGKTTVTGLSKDFNADFVIQNAIKRLTPSTVVESLFWDYSGKHLCAVKVEKSAKTIAYDNKAYAIKGNIVKPIENLIKNKEAPQKTSASEGASGKNIFISYNWAHKDMAQKLYDFLTGSGYSVTMDDHKLRYKDKISSFMASIRESNYVILIISDEYLKSPNCMTEVLHVLKDLDAAKKILPIRHQNAKFFKTKDRLAYVSYWAEQVKETEELLKGVETTSAIEEFKQLKTIKNISQDINDFLSAISDMITSTIEEQEKAAYKDVINYIEHH